MFRISVKEATDHALVLSIVFDRFLLKEVDAAFAQRQSDLYAFVPKHQVFGSGQKVWDDLGLTQGLSCVFDFRVHRVAYPFASSRHRGCE